MDESHDPPRIIRIVPEKPAAGAVPFVPAWVADAQVIDSGPPCDKKAMSPKSWQKYLGQQQQRRYPLQKTAKE